MFRNREEAGRTLAEKLSHYRNDPTGLILALPRGGVAVGYQLSLALHIPLDVFITRKIGAPGNPEYAIGAVAESGWTHVQDYGLGVGDTYVKRETAAQLERLHERRTRYGAAGVPAAGRIAIVVDDGLATGATMIAALHALREQRPQRLICAVPVAAPDSLERVRELADEVVCLHAPADFHAVGQFYDQFDQVDDAEVLEALQSARSANAPQGARAAGAQQQQGAPDVDELPSATGVELRQEEPGVKTK